jgi:hypothetical protein
MLPNNNYDICTLTWTPNYNGISNENSNGNLQWPFQWHFQWASQWVFQTVFPLDYCEWNEVQVNVDIEPGSCDGYSSTSMTLPQWLKVT